MNMNQRGIAIYLRVSSDDKQNPQNSFDYQRERIMGAIGSTGTDLPILVEYKDIFTGTSTKRPGYQDMLTDARNHQFSHLAVYSVDRIGRDASETLVTVKELMGLGIEIIVADSPNMQVSTPSGALFLNIRVAIAEYETNLMKQRVRDSKLAALMAGNWPFPVPDGYMRGEKE